LAWLLTDDDESGNYSYYDSDDSEEYDSFSTIGRDEDDDTSSLLLEDYYYDDLTDPDQVLEQLATSNKKKIAAGVVPDSSLTLDANDYRLESETLMELTIRGDGASGFVVEGSKVTSSQTFSTASDADEEEETVVEFSGTLTTTHGDGAEGSSEMAMKEVEDAIHASLAFQQQDQSHSSEIISSLRAAMRAGEAVEVIVEGESSSQEDGFWEDSSSATTVMMQVVGGHVLKASYLKTAV
jgi:hypothetical protein